MFIYSVFLCWKHCFRCGSYCFSSIRDSFVSSRPSWVRHVSVFVNIEAFYQPQEHFSGWFCFAVKKSEQTVSVRVQIKSSKEHKIKPWLLNGQPL